MAEARAKYVPVVLRGTIETPPTPKLIPGRDGKPGTTLVIMQIKVVDKDGFKQTLNLRARDGVPFPEKLAAGQQFAALVSVPVYSDMFFCDGFAPAEGR